MAPDITQDFLRSFPILCRKLEPNYGSFNIKFQGPRMWNSIDDNNKLLTLSKFKKKRNSISSKIIDLDNVNITVLLNFFILCFTAILFFLFLVCFLRLLHTIFFCLMCVCIVSVYVFHSGASWVRKNGNPSMREILVMASGMARGRVRLRPTACVRRPR